MLEFTLKTPWADGTTALLLSPQELLEKLAALDPYLILGSLSSFVPPH